MKSLRRDLAVNVQGEMVYRALEPHPLLNKELATGRDLRDDLLDRVVISVFMDGREPVRSAVALDARIAAHRAGIGLPLQEISRTVQMALERLARIRIALPKANASTAADIRLQLSWLVPAGFLLNTPWEYLKEFPRYLQAIEQRSRNTAAIRSATPSSPRKWRRSNHATASRSRPSEARVHRPPMNTAGCWRSCGFAVRTTAQDAGAGIRAQAGRGLDGAVGKGPLIATEERCNPRRLSDTVLTR